jgi:hypothetical protein
MILNCARTSRASSVELPKNDELLIQGVFYAGLGRSNQRLASNKTVHPKGLVYSIVSLLPTDAGRLLNFEANFGSKFRQVGFVFFFKGTLKQFLCQLPLRA